MAWKTATQSFMVFKGTLIAVLKYILKALLWKTGIPITYDENAYKNKLQETEKLKWCHFHALHTKMDITIKC